MKGNRPRQPIGAHLYLDIAKPGYLFHGYSSDMSVPARLSDWLSRPGWMVGYRLGYPEDSHQGGVLVSSMMMIHIDESNYIISQLYVLDLCHWFE